MKIFYFIFFLLTETSLWGQNYVSQIWAPDNGDGTYKNPVLFADYSDPDVCRSGDDYYLVSSSFTCSPGLPILHSKDLVNWKIINYALKKQVPEDVFDKVQQMKGVWAPAIRFHKGEYYIYYPDPDVGIYMIKTRNPAAEWSKPLLVIGGKGMIDPCPLWDKDGKVFLVNGWAGSRAGLNSVISVYRMNTEGSKVMDEGKIVYDGRPVNTTVEGPKIYLRNGFYYIFAPAGGVSYGWQLVLRSKNIYGPYEEKIVMDQGSTTMNGPHQGAWVDTQTGEDWFIHFQDKFAYGRVIDLQPVHWVKNWPVIGIDKNGDGKGEPVDHYKKPNVKKTYALCNPVENDEFNTDSLGLQWQWDANPKITWFSLIPGNNFLRLYSVKQSDSHINLWDVPSLLMQKLPAPDFTVTTKVSFSANGEGTKTGLTIFGRDYSALTLEKIKNGSFKIAQVVCLNADLNAKDSILEGRSISDSLVYLRIKVSAPEAVCKFSYSTDGTTFIDLGNKFKARQGGWMGAKIGIYCITEPLAKTRGYADFDWFRFSK